MIVIDDNMLRLAKMQETLLKVSVDNRDENVEKYCQIVTDIDRQAFASLLDYIGQVNIHNRSLEEELEFLEGIKNYYEQVNELQVTFKNVSDSYGGKLSLSDLSQINIEYVENRISAISGYLINNKNLDINKKKLKELNEELVIEEKNNKKFVEELKRYEELLKEIFLNSEGRAIIDGKLAYIDVISEYDRIGFDFKELLLNEEELKKRLDEVIQLKNAAELKLKTAEICYNAMPNSDNKSIYDDINKEYLCEKYKFIMLKILQLLARNYDNFDLIISKRTDLIDLINGRKKCLDMMGITVSYDPFSVSKVGEQLDEISRKKDNSKVINRLLKSIAELSERIDEMESRIDEYLLVINDVRDIIVSRVGISDIDISSVVLDSSVDDIKHEILDNQVVEVRNFTEKFNMSVVRQKANSVIRRVYEMIGSVSKKEEVKDNTVAPQLVVVSSPVSIEKDTEDILTDDEVKNMQRADVLEPVVEEENLVEINNEETSARGKTSIVFETVDPFLDVPLFLEKTDDFDNTVTEEVTSDVVDKKAEVFPVSESEEVMPDAFWVTQDDGIKNIGDEVILSFDDQIDALLSNGDSTKIKKKIA